MPKSKIVVWSAAVDKLGLQRCIMLLQIDHVIREIASQHKPEFAGITPVRSSNAVEQFVIQYSRQFEVDEDAEYYTVLMAYHYNRHDYGDNWLVCQIPKFVARVRVNVAAGHYSNDIRMLLDIAMHPERYW